jgi:hypothetical protein
LNTIRPLGALGADDADDADDADVADGADGEPGLLAEGSSLPELHPETTSSRATQNALTANLAFVLHMTPASRAHGGDASVQALSFLQASQCGRGHHQKPAHRLEEGGAAAPLRGGVTRVAGPREWLA